MFKKIKLVWEIKKIIGGKNMQKILEGVKKILSLLPFNNHKTTIGDIISILSTLAMIIEIIVPHIQTIIPFLPPQYSLVVTAGVGLLIRAVGIIHKILKTQTAIEN